MYGKFQIMRDVANNSLSGTMPMSNWTQLKTLELHNNHFTGVVPTGLGVLPNLGTNELITLLRATFLI